MSRTKYLSAILCAVATSLFAASASHAAPTEDGLYAVFNTSLGDFTAELFYEEAPLSTANLVGLAEGTVPHYQNGSDTPIYAPFYNGLTFHRVIDGFVIQGGDPAGNGTGGPGYDWPDEVRSDLAHDAEGILSMANSGPNTNGSQFFVTLAPTPNLNGIHNVFGKVVEGIESVQAIGDTPVDPADRPLATVTLTTIEILRIGSEAQAFDPTLYATHFDPTIPLFGEKQLVELQANPAAENQVAATTPLSPMTEYRFHTSSDLQQWTEAKRVQPSLSPEAPEPSYLIDHSPPNQEFVQVEATTRKLSDVHGTFEKITFVSGTDNFTETITFSPELVGDYQAATAAAVSVEYDWLEIGNGRVQLKIRFANNAMIQFFFNPAGQSSGSAYLRVRNRFGQDTFIGEGSFALAPAS